MDEKFRHRLIGATVWIALAVIFFPAIFDGAGYQALHRTDTGFSGTPDVEIKSPTADTRYKTMNEKLRLQPNTQAPEQQPESHDDQKPSSSSPASHKAQQKPGDKTAAANSTTMAAWHTAPMTVNPQAHTKAAAQQPLNIYKPPSVHPQAHTKAAAQQPRQAI